VGAPQFRGHINPYGQLALADLARGFATLGRLPKIFMASGGRWSSPQARKDLAEIERSPFRQAAPRTFSHEICHGSCLRQWGVGGIGA
jgi:hypothetical protein